MILENVKEMWTEVKHACCSVWSLCTAHAWSKTLQASRDLQLFALAADNIIYDAGPQNRQGQKGC